MNIKNNEPENIVTGASDVIVERVIDKSHSILYPIQVVICDESLIPSHCRRPMQARCGLGKLTNTSSHHTMAAVSGYSDGMVTVSCPTLSNLAG